MIPRPILSPSFSLARGEWIPRAFTWDPETGVFESVEGPAGFRDYRHALEASRFLVRAMLAQPRSSCR